MQKKMGVPLDLHLSGAFKFNFKMSIFLWYFSVKGSILELREKQKYSENCLVLMKSKN
jgi:hypothetical protein